MLHDYSLDTILDQHARSYPSETAVFDVDGTELTFAELNNRVNRLANHLEDNGFQREDRILWLAQNSFRVLEGVLACARLGGMFCPINWRQSASEFAFVIDDLKPNTVIVQSEEIGETVNEGIQLASHQAPLMLNNDSQTDDSYETFIAVGSDESRKREIDIGSPVVAMYTAAFGGHPNAAQLSQRAFLWQSTVINTIFGIDGTTIFLNSGPLFHIGTLQFTLSTFYAGGVNAFVRRTDGEAMCQAVHQFRCTHGFIANQTAMEMAAANAGGKYDLSCYQSEPISDAWDDMVTIVAPQDFDRTAGYGQTEVCGLAVWEYFGRKSQGRSGRPAPFTQAAVLDDEGNMLPPGEVGEIALRGPTVMNGYWNRPELNEARKQNGWHLCNDLGRQEEDGSFTFIGPKTQMIKSGIENIYPAEVENCLKTHTAVADCAVIGTPDVKWIQNVKAIVQLHDGTSVSPEELIAHCRANIASYKKPKSVEFVEQIPRHPDYSVDYRRLDEQFGGGGYPSSATRSK